MAAPARLERETQHRPRYEGLRVTREEYLDLEPDGFKYDMIEGVLTVSPSADFDHGKAYGKFFHFLYSYLRDHPLGEVTLETDIFLPDGGDVLRPDLCFLLTKNLSKIKRRIHGAPDLICETLSDSSAERDTGEKSRRYLACGVREYWLIDPRNRAIETRYAVSGAGGQPAWENVVGNTLESRLLPGFRLNTNEFWKI